MSALDAAIVTLAAAAGLREVATLARELAAYRSKKTQGGN